MVMLSIEYERGTTITVFPFSLLRFSCILFLSLLPATPTIPPTWRTFYVLFVFLLYMLRHLNDIELDLELLPDRFTINTRDSIVKIDLTYSARL